MLAIYGGFLGDNGLLSDVLLLARWSSVAAIVVLAGLVASWRWIPPIQKLIFPYLGGDWSGVVEFSHQGRKDMRPVTLTVKHTLLGLKLVLHSRESTSRTLAVHAEVDKAIDRYRLYYVYLNERNEGVENSGQSYRGLAILRVDRQGDISLVGSYFTETNRQGQIRLYPTKPNSWWNLLK